MLVSTSCLGQQRAFNLPPAQRLMEPGPGVGGPGPGVLHPMASSMVQGGGGGIAQTMGMYSPGCAAPSGPGATSQIAFLGVEE